MSPPTNAPGLPSRGLSYRGGNGIAIVAKRLRAVLSVEHRDTSHRWKDTLAFSKASRWHTEIQGVGDKAILGLVWEATCSLHPFLPHLLAGRGDPQHPCRVCAQQAAVWTTRASCHSPRHRGATWAPGCGPCSHLSLLIPSWGLMFTLLSNLVGFSQLLPHPCHLHPLSGKKGHV